MWSSRMGLGAGARGSGPRGPGSRTQPATERHSYPVLSDTQT